MGPIDASIFNQIVELLIPHMATVKNGAHWWSRHSTVHLYWARYVGMAQHGHSLWRWCAA